MDEFEPEVDYEFLERDAERVLTSGFDLPATLERTKVAPFAVWKHERWGAVLYIHRRVDDKYESHLIDAHWDENHWTLAGAFGGASWPDPFDRPATGWDGDPLIWCGDGVAMSGDEVRRMPSGIASRMIARLDVVDAEGQLVDTIDVSDRLGVFVTGVTRPGWYTIVGHAADGSVVRDGEGVEVRDIFECSAEFFRSPADDWILEQERGPSGEAAVTSIIRDAEGHFFTDTGKGLEPLDDPDLIARFERPIPRAERPRRLSPEEMT